MGIVEIILISIGLGMDAFAVAICKGLSMKKMNWKKAFIIALYFGVFQALMPFLGYELGINFKDAIQEVDHWIAFILLASIGINMIREALKKDDDDVNDDVGFKTMIVLALATSIDALAVGVTFAFLEVQIAIPIIMIGIITFIMSFVGVKIGNYFKDKFKDKAEILGGIILIAMGAKILIEHLIGG